MGLIWKHDVDHQMLHFLVSEGLGVANNFIRI